MAHALPSRVPHRWEQVLRSTWGEAVASALLVSALVSGVLIVEQWHTWTQPDRAATVLLASFTGHDRFCGKGCRCPEMIYTTVEAAADGVHTTGRATFKECAHEYAVGEPLFVRHWRDDPGRVDADPVPGVLVAPFALGAGVLAAGLVVLCSHVSVRWRRHRETRRRRRSVTAPG